MKENIKCGNISLVLAIALIFTSLVIPFGSFAVEATAPDCFLFLNRDFEDNTVLTNGFSPVQIAGNSITLEKEGDNTFMHWVYDSTHTATKHGHFNIDISNHLPEEGSLVLRAKVRTTDISSTNRHAFLVRPYDYHHGADIMKPNGDPYGYNSNGTYLLTFNRMLLGGKYKAALKQIGSSTLNLAEKFVEVAYVFTWTDKANVTVNAYYDGGITPVVSSRLTSYGVDARPCLFRFQVNEGPNLSWDLDDLELYIAYTTDPTSALSVENSPTNRGSLFNISSGTYVDPDQYNGHYFFKVNSDKALDKDGNTVHTLAQKPYSDAEGKIWFPVSALEGVVGSISPNAPVSIVTDIPSVRMEDISLAIPGYYYSYSSCGLIAISEEQEVFVEGADDESIIPIMQKFLFDHVDSSLQKVEAFSVEDGQYLDHPYILANQDKFDELRSVYLDADGSADPVHKGYITNRVSAAASIYTTYAVESGGAYASLNDRKGLAGGQSDIYEMPYLDNQGYDIGGRHSQATTHAGNIMSLAFGYQITRDEKYAMLAYDYALAIGGWEHWGPGHFLNCADAVAPYSIAFDWLYDAWVDLGLDVTKIEEIIFTHGVVPGYYSRSANTIPVGWMRYISGVLTKSGWEFAGTNNWNAVCSSGMVIASLAIVGKTTPTANIYIDTKVNGLPFEKTQLVTDLGSHAGLTTYRDYAEWLINECMYGMAMNGLYQYIPDGSYIESSGYWSYGTNNFFEMVAALTTATEYNTGVSNDFGMLDAWGIDRTCDYALNTQSSDYVTFNYHDSGAGVQDTSWFPYYGNYTGRTDLAELRNVALASGKSGSPTIQDVLFYKKGSGEYTKPALQYWWEGINGYVVRDSWETGAIYAGIMGDTNNLGHGQIDSGSFVYHNGGTVWFCDIGTENYNCYGFWGASTRYRYYKMSAEGNNTLFLAGRDSVPYGQTLNGFGKIIETGDNSYGAYAVMDNTSVYGGYANYAYRGMLFTNDRRTVVIQDEVKFNMPEDAYWVGHTQQNVVLSVDGTVAYMTDGKSVIRVTILDQSNSGIRFEIEDCYTFHLKACEGMDELAQEYYEKGTHENNVDRSMYKRLTIALKNVTEVKLAVVIEEVAVGELSELGYEWQGILDWNESTPSANGGATEAAAGFFDGENTVGSIISTLGNLSYIITDLGGNTAYAIGAGSTSVASSISFTSLERLSEFGYLGDRIIAVELDISTYSVFPDNTLLSLNGKGGELIGIDMSALGSVAASKWERATLIIDGGEMRYFIFFGNSLIDSGSFTGASVEDLSVTFSSSAGSITSGSIIVDNLSIRIFGSDYTSLDGVLAGAPITDWQGRTPVEESQSAAVATLWVLGDLTSPDLDTPIIDLAGRTHNVMGSGSDIVATVKAYSWAEVIALMNRVYKMELHASNLCDPITVNYPLTVDTNGYKFRASSEKYSAFVSGETIEYRTGSITVTWVTDEESFTEIYHSSTVASYKGAALDKTITEHAVAGGYEYFVKDGWSLTRGGAPLSDDEMIVTSENCTFYQAQRECDNVFVTVMGTNIVGYDDSDKLFTMALSGNYDRISLIKDVVLDGTKLSQRWSGVVNLYLNGNSITYRTTVASDHFNQHSAYVNIYGPGRLVNEAVASNLFLVTGGKTYVEGVTIDSACAVTDHRGGTIEFVNCEINITRSGAWAFGVRNRNNVYIGTQRPILIIDGCRINMPYVTASTAVFSVACNSIFEITDTEINAPKAKYLFNLENSIVGSAPSYSFANGYKNMEVRIGSIFYNFKASTKVSTNDPTGATYPEMLERIGYIEGATVDSPDGNTVVYDGCVIARRTNPAAPYIVVRPEDAALVTWRVGMRTYSEYWVKGSTPIPDSPEVVDLAMSDIDGKKYSFASRAVTSDTELVGVLVTDFPVRLSISLHTGFTVNTYVGITDGVSLTGFKIDGESVTGIQCTLDGEQYIKLSFTVDDPTEAARERKLTITFNDTTSDVTGATVSVDISIISYIEQILAGDYTAEEKGLMGNVLKYIKSAYEYVGNTMSPDYRAVTNLYVAYPEHITVSAVKRENVDMSAISSSVSGAALLLENTPAFRFYVTDSFTGYVTVSYVTAVDGSSVSRTFNSDNHLLTEERDGVMRRYFDLVMKPFDLASTLSIDVNGTTVEYGLNAYYHAVSDRAGSVTEFINAIFAYAESARKYRASLD